MATFDKYTNLVNNALDTIKAAERNIIFGEYQPVLEVELNEMQEILHNKFKYALAYLVGGEYYAAKGGYFNVGTMTFNAGTFSIANEAFVLRGQFVYIPSMSIAASNGDNIFLTLAVANVTKDSTLLQYGVVGGSSLANHIGDTRFAEETSRRKILTLTLEKNLTAYAGNSIFADLSTAEDMSIQLGTVVDGKFVTTMPRIRNLTADMNELESWLAKWEAKDITPASVGNDNTSYSGGTAYGTSGTVIEGLSYRKRLRYLPYVAIFRMKASAVGTSSITLKIAYSDGGTPVEIATRTITATEVGTSWAYIKLPFVFNPPGAGYGVYPIAVFSVAGGATFTFDSVAVMPDTAVLA